MSDSQEAAFARGSIQELSFRVKFQVFKFNWVDVFSTTGVGALP